MTEFGIDIDEYILLRLEPNDLIQCKRVCKSWNSLISSDRFVKSQLGYNLRKKVDNNAIGDIRITALYERRRGDYHDCLVGSSNGLVCICYAFEFLVVNPSTGKVKELRSPEYSYYSERVYVSGFGYDSSVDDYKVFIGLYDMCTKKRSFKVLSVKSNVWRSIAVESGYGCISGKGILCNGAIHLCMSRNYKKFIASFDLDKEVFKEIPQPKLVRSDWKLGTVNDCLCIFASPNSRWRKNKDIEIWVLRNYSVQESWERKLLPPGYDTQKPMNCYTLPDDYSNNHHVDIWMSEEGSSAPVLVRSIERPHHKHFLHYNVPKYNIWLSMYSECNYNFDDPVFVKSLVSPHGMGDGDGHVDGDGCDSNIDFVNDLIRCKSVCKSRNPLISSDRFINSHLNFNFKKKVADNNETGDIRITASYASNRGYYDDCLVGSSNGLVCISRYVFEFLVVNPSTGEVKELRNPGTKYNDRSKCVSGFGYDSSKDDYKVIIGFKRTKKISFKVLTLKSNLWRSVAVELGYDNLFGNGIVCNGAIHWTTSRNKKKVIVSFDLSKEVFKEIPQPKLVPSDWKLGTMNGCLCIFASPNIQWKKNEDIEIWVMRNYTVQESWERKLLPPGYDTQKPMNYYKLPDDYSNNHHVDIWMAEEGSCAPVLVRSIERPHHKCAHDKRHNDNIRLSTNPECNYNYDEHVFVKSLVSPHGMGDGDDSNIDDDAISLSTLFL